MRFDRVPLELLLGVVALVPATAAYSNCAGLLKTLGAAEHHPRVAIFRLGSRDAPVAGKAIWIRIGKVEWLEDGNGSYERSEDDEPDEADKALAELGIGYASTRMACSSLGEDTWQGIPVTKMRIEYVPPIQGATPSTYWLARSTGLPVYEEHEGDGPGGNAWVYGDAVKEPDPNR
jgi:hypothetical protein